MQHGLENYHYDDAVAAAADDDSDNSDDNAKQPHPLMQHINMNDDCD